MCRKQQGVNFIVKSSVPVLQYVFDGQIARRFAHCALFRHGGRQPAVSQSESSVGFLAGRHRRRWNLWYFGCEQRLHPVDKEFAATTTVTTAVLASKVFCYWADSGPTQAMCSEVGMGAAPHTQTSSREGVSSSSLRC